MLFMPKRTVIYSGIGVSERTLRYWQNLFDTFDLGELDRVDDKSFSHKRIAGSDLLVLPGGDSREMCLGLGAAGKEAIRRYVNEGGTLLGVCAGAYAVSQQLPQFLAVSPIAIADYPHAHRGTKNIKVRFNALGAEWFNVEEGKDFEFFYHHGPVPIYVPTANCGDFQVLAIFQEDFRRKDGLPGTMVGRPAAWSNRFGQGRVFAISPHIEQTPQKEYILAEMVWKISEIFQEKTIL